MEALDVVVVVAGLDVEEEEVVEEEDLIEDVVEEEEDLTGEEEEDLVVTEAVEAVVALIGEALREVLMVEIIHLHKIKELNLNDLYPLCLFFVNYHYKFINKSLVIVISNIFSP